MTLLEYANQNGINLDEWPSNYPLGTSCDDAGYFLKLGVLEVLDSQSPPHKRARIIFLEHGYTIAETTHSSALV